MGMSVRVAGGADLTSVRRNLRLTGDQELSRRMSRGFQRAAKPIKPAVQASAVKVLPKRGGYGELMSRSVRVRITTRERRGTASVTIRVVGAGKQENRDIARINKGILRHPIPAGRKHPWVNQTVRRGFVDRPVDGLSPDAAREMRAVVEWIASQITKR
ncbi:MAG TPA: hypothetical protein VIQ30_25635 [Pseudonocardia sp.]